jgi:hypothetical protein
MPTGKRKNLSGWMAPPRAHRLKKVLWVLFNQHLGSMSNFAYLSADFDLYIGAPAFSDLDARLAMATLLRPACLVR